MSYPIIKKITLLLMSLSLYHTIQAQTNFNKAWVLGASGIARVTRFSHDSIINQYYLSTPPTMPWFALGHSNICDSSGKLVLLSDGYNLYDSNLNYIEGGQKLAFDSLYIRNQGTISSESQWSVILPFSNGIYYMINEGVSKANMLTWYTPNFIPNDYLHYHKVDMKANGGLGKVTHPMQTLDTGRFNAIGMMACKHANKKDWWLLKLGGDSMTFYTYLFKEDTVIKYGEQIFGGFPPSEWGLSGITLGNLEGQMMFNSIGTKMSCAVRSTKRFFEFDFDRSTGILSNPVYHNNRVEPGVIDPNNPTQEFIFPSAGGCYSPNSRFYYLTTCCSIWQYDTQDPDTNTAWYRVTRMDTTATEFTGYANIYPGLDKKLYVGNWNTTSKQMSVILRPNEKGMDCLFCPRCLRYDSVFNYPGISQPPCMPNYDLDIEPLAVKDINELKGFMVYPNPASTYITIESEQFNNQTNEVVIATMLGQVVQRQQFKTNANKYKVDVSGLTKGVYLVTVKSLGNERQVFCVRKVVVE